MGTPQIIISGRRATIVVTDPKTQKKTLGVDETPMVVRYRDVEDARRSAARLLGLSQQNPNAAVELRDSEMPTDAKGKSMPLSEWIEACAKQPAAPTLARAATPKPAEPIEAVLAASESAVPASAPAPAAPK